EHLVLTDGEAAPLAEQELLRLELRHQPRGHEAIGALAGSGLGFRLFLTEHILEPERIDEPAAADEVHKFIERRWSGHGVPLTDQEPPTLPTWGGAKTAALN